MYWYINFVIMLILLLLLLLLLLFKVIMSRVVCGYFEVSVYQVILEIFVSSED